jgi:hypothetical protein
VTASVRAVTSYAFGQHPWLERIYAVPFAWSSASIRVLEKTGYRLEGRMRRSAIKDDQVVDQLLYAQSCETRSRCRTRRRHTDFDQYGSTSLRSGDAERIAP